MDYILEKKHHYKEFIDGQTVESYTIQKRKEGTWGDSLEMSVFALLFGVTINVYYYEVYPIASFKAGEQNDPQVLNFRRKIYADVIAERPCTEMYLTHVENERKFRQNQFKINVLYKNGNHYDCLLEMTADEQRQVIDQFYKTVTNIFFLELV